MSNLWAIHNASKIKISALIKNLESYQKEYPQIHKQLESTLDEVKNCDLNKQFSRIHYYTKYNEVCVVGVYFVKYMLEDYEDVICDYCFAERKYIISQPWELAMSGVTALGAIGLMFCGNFLVGGALLGVVSYVNYKIQCVNIDQGMLHMNFDILLQDMKIITDLSNKLKSE
jgi:mRNA-degrading endonuclease HigB of HigAB toxin-antitoxin module